ncbi:MAG: hypothetical protein IT261_01030 [Saprospiraceae bacterium]|nr:hypothetical protein [Saprospiraceae bacterium]
MTGSIKVPKGFRVILYNQKKFKGKKLEIDASGGPVNIPDLSAGLSTFKEVKNGDTSINWMFQIQSIQIILSDSFPPKM